MSSAPVCELDSIAAIAPVAGLRFGAPDEHDPSRPEPGSCAPDNGAHTWPGSTHDFGEPVSHEVPANATMWRFFEQHPRR